MATLPLLLSLAEGLDGLDDFYGGRSPRYYYPQRHHQNHHHPSLRLTIPSFNAIKKAKGEQKGAVSAVGKDGFQVCMDVQQFKPSELTVKTVDNSIVIEGKHDERPDEHGFISRHFVRRYMLPDGYDPKQVVSTLSSDGVLTVKVPQPQKTESNERIVQIQHTGPAHLTVKDNTAEEKEEKEKEK